MRKTKIEKGITLIALIITIVVLLILAVVAINSITNDGILSKATDAATKWNLAVNNEKERMNEYENFLNGLDSTGSGSGSGSEGGSGGGSTQTVTDVKNKVISTESNTEVVDAYGNKIVVPAGFKIVVDSTTNNADTVTEGIVIEDSTGNQFVWIPVGKIYTDTAKTESIAITITLGRYVFDSTTGEASEYSGSYTEGVKDSTTPNAHARDIEAFVTSATTKGGYYIGRYEARTNNKTGRSAKTDALTAVTSIKTNAVYNYVTQSQATSLAQGMYADGYSSGTFSSDLINSYAWDTAIVFLQEFDDRVENKKTTPYSRQTSLNGSFSSTGTTDDIICNVYDMASNCWEWSTETSSDAADPCANRGGHYDRSDHCTSTRYGYNTPDSYSYNSFRLILYVGL